MGTEMKIAATGTLNREGNFLLYHGPYEEILPRMAEDLSLIHI